MGLVTVALLTLPPLALRPVRLACLIHAANVHSEPGSNPSINFFHPLMIARERLINLTESLTGKSNLFLASTASPLKNQRGLAAENRSQSSAKLAENQN